MAPTFRRFAPYGGVAQRGVSLVELMVALAIGTVLLLGLVQIFGASRAAFATAEGMSRVQENGRFASELLRRELRMAGHLGCLNETGYTASPDPQLFNHLANPSTNLAGAPFVFRIDMPIQGWEATNTGPNQAVNLTAAAAGWGPALPGALGAVAAEASNGSDILAIRYLSADSIGLVGLGVNGNAVNISPAEAVFVQDQMVYAVLNCKFFSLFQARSAPDASGIFNAGVGGLNVSGWSGSEGPYGVQLSRLHRFNMAVYYVAPDVGGVRSLFRRVANPAAPVPHLGEREALIEGVESMQILYGIDTDAPLDGQPDRYNTAAAVNALDPANPQVAWRRVVNMRVSVLTASAQPSAAVPDGASTHRVADVVITPPNDGRVRQVYETLITVRNRVR